MYRFFPRFSCDFCTNPSFHENNLAVVVVRNTNRKDSINTGNVESPLAVSNLFGAHYNGAIP